MIIRIHPRDISPNEPLTEALGRPVSDQEGLTDQTVVAHWPGLDYYTLDDEQKTWTSAEWAEHLDDPNWQHPFVASPQNDRRAIWHADVLLHPDDRDLTGSEWAEIAHRIARVAGIQRPGGENGCRWIAVQAQPGRLDLLANLIRPDDTWTAQHHQLPALLATESRRIEAELNLRSPQGGGPDPEQRARFAQRSTASANDASPGAADATTQLAGLLRQLSDENTGPLATVRGLVEHTAHRLDHLPHAYGPAAAHQLELIARRLHSIQQDLDATAAALPATPRPTPPSTGWLPRLPRPAPG
ncbi:MULTISPECIES: hypothetical protein [Streptomyces]|uniref:Relaxase/mobilization nuclease n=1 Tax=Streptomyces dengpaensis TaxID=2049881 RepID=A0ABN5HX02_9ACTN|nr:MULTISPECIES: hypothetical protein [Streptomyces]AVH55684.1 hypothetical protein C4B68_07720 [Streptomyces dengpaensis]PIB11946.1 hypothetical protein B1C81_01680 [Streptomyces sp. HG99]